MAQIADIKTFDKGMNKDVDPRLVQPGEYVDAQNIMLSNYRQGRVGIATNMPGLTLRYNFAYTTVGLFKDELNNVLYVFEYQSSSVKRIYRFNLSNNTFTTLLSTSVLPWTASTNIISCRVIEGILVWTDGENEIGMFNMNITYPTPYTAEMFTLAQVVPHDSPSVAPANDSSYGYNNILGKFFQFKIRFLFQTGHKSVFGPISEVAYTFDDYSAPDIVASKTNTVNSIELGLSGAGANELVEKIEIAARAGNDGDFYSIATIDANSTFQAGGVQTYTFYNESLYDPIPLEESNQIYDDVPRTAQALEIGDNRVILGDVLTGYDKIDLDYTVSVVYDDLVGSGGIYESQDAGYLAAVGSSTPRTPMSSGSALSTFFNHFGYTTPVAGDVITVAGKDIPSGIYDTYIHPFGYASYTIQSGDSWTDVYNALRAVEFYNIYAGGMLDIYDITTNNIPPDSQPTGNDAFQFSLKKGQHVKTFKSGTWYIAGLQYFDTYGRTNGAQFKEGSKVYIPTLGERGLTPGSVTNAGAAKINVTIAHEAPSWAAYYKIVYSRANVNDFVLQITTLAATASGVNTMLDISCISTWNESKGGNLGYIWEKGDRVKILTYDQGGTVYTDWADDLYDAEIIEDDSTGNYSIVIPTPSGLASSNLEGAIIEIYRPSKELDASDSIFTEVPVNHEIYESGGNYYHRGDTDQTAVVDAVVQIEGDAYLKSRDDFPYGSTPLYAGIAFESYDISDYRDSAHYDKGRPTAVINQEQSQKASTLMYSEFIIPNTDINNLNRFYPDVNFEEYERQFGSIKLLHNEEDHLLMLQEDRASKVYLNRQMMYDGQGNGQLVGTQKRVLSQAVPYAGVYGIHDYRSFQAIGNRRYWVDGSRGVALRLSINGIEEISRYGMRGWFAEKCAALMDTANEVVVGAYDVQNDQYILNFDAANSVLNFDEKLNAWVSFITFMDFTRSVYINNRTFMVINNDLYEMNNYTALNTGTGSAQSSFIKTVSNVEPATLKNYFAIAIDGSHALDVAIETEALYGGTNQQSTLDRALDFRQRETEWHAAFLRDANTPNVTNPLLEGDTIKGKDAKITLTLPAAIGSQQLLLKLVKVIVSKG
jgi:hypothetical protein